MHRPFPLITPPIAFMLALFAPALWLLSWVLVLKHAGNWQMFASQVTLSVCCYVFLTASQTRLGLTYRLRNLSPISLILALATIVIIPSLSLKLAIIGHVLLSQLVAFSSLILVVEAGMGIYRSALQRKPNRN